MTLSVEIRKRKVVATELEDPALVTRADTERAPFTGNIRGSTSVMLTDKSGASVPATEMLECARTKKENKLEIMKRQLKAPTFILLDKRY